jgi:hypothetical protein
VTAAEEGLEPLFIAQSNRNYQAAREARFLAEKRRWMQRNGLL